jgi:hypothetical protein
VKYLMAAYELGVPPREILDSLDLAEESGDRVLEALVKLGMIVWPAKGELMLTERGLGEAEGFAYEPPRLEIGPLAQTQVFSLTSSVAWTAPGGHLRTAGAGDVR